VMFYLLLQNQTWIVQGGFLLMDWKMKINGEKTAYPSKTIEKHNSLFGLNEP